MDKLHSLRMGRAPCCEKVGLKKGRWTKEEDEILTKYIQANGKGSWRSMPKNAGTNLFMEFVSSIAVYFVLPGSIFIFICVCVCVCLSVCELPNKNYSLICASDGLLSN